MNGKMCHFIFHVFLYLMFVESFFKLPHRVLRVGTYPEGCAYTLLGEVTFSLLRFLKAADQLYFEQIRLF